MRLLRETLRALVLEAIHRPSVGSEPKKVARFEFNEFKKLPSLSAMIKYADDRLDFLGQGSSRTVFRFTGTKVLKLANSLTKGIAQNKAEVDVFTNPEVASITTKIFDFDPKFRWLVTEVVRPFESHADFENITGVDWYHFEDMLYIRRVSDDYKDADPDVVKFLTSAIKLSNIGLVFGDLAVFKHWGKTADGRAVILDYGFTESVANSYGTGKFSSAISDEKKEDKSIPADEDSGNEPALSTSKSPKSNSPRKQRELPSKFAIIQKNIR